MKFSVKFDMRAPDFGTPANELYSHAGPEVLPGIASGAAQAANIPPTQFGAQMPINDWAGSLISTSTSGDFLPEFFLGTALATQVSQDEALQAELDAQGVKLLTSMYTPAAKLLCRVPVTDLASAKGLRAYGAGKLGVAELEALGM